MRGSDRLWLAAYNTFLPLALGGVLLIPEQRRKLMRRTRVAGESIRAALRRAHELRADGRRVLLFHAASAGEYEQLRPILRRVDRSRFILIQSFFSPTIFDREAQSELFDAACYHPLDLPWLARPFFGGLSPSDYIVTRHDLWPNHLVAARRAGIHTTLLNANLHGSSLRLHALARPANRALFGLFDTILTGSERLRERLGRILPSSRIEITGDTRFDQVWERAKAHAKEGSSLIPAGFAEGRRILVLGSVLECDERVLFEGWRRPFARGDAALAEAGIALIYVPHETGEKEIGRAEREFRALGIAVCRLSRAEWYRGEPVLLVDRVGILPELYAWADLAYVGGGFGGGVHSVIEPAAQGAAVAFGPRVDILDEAIDLVEQGIGLVLHKAAEVPALLALLRDDAALERRRAQALEFVRQRTGAAERVLARLFGST